MKMTPSQAARARQAFRDAVEIVGGKAVIARHFGISDPAVINWHEIVPKNRVEGLVQLIAMHIAKRPSAPTEKDLRPDL